MDSQESSDGIVTSPPYAKEHPSAWRLSGPVVYVLAGLLVTSIGIADTLTGRELSFSILYTGPVALVAWRASTSAALGFSVLCALVSLLADLAHLPETSVGLAIWNVIVRFGFFVALTVGLVHIRKLLQREHRLAWTDHLTGTANGRQFHHAVAREVARARRNGTSLTIAYMDLDHFKEINDRFGHLIGDEVLQATAEVLLKSVRINDLVARMGGDEFALLLPETSENQAEVAIQRIRTAMDERMRKSRWPAQASIGAVTYPTPPDSIDEMIRLADDLMYRAKRERKGILFETHSAAVEAESGVSKDHG